MFTSMEIDTPIAYLFHCLGDDDVRTGTGQIVITPPENLVSQVFFTLVADGISQEGNETFSIEMSSGGMMMNINARELTARLHGLIVDQDGKHATKAYIVLH